MDKFNFFEKLAHFTVKRYKAVLITTAVFLVLSLVSIGKFTKIKTNFKDMLRKNNAKLEEFNRITDNFSSADNVLIMLEGKTEKMTRFAEYFVKQIEHDKKLKKYIKKIEYKIDRKFFINKGLLLSKVNDLRSMKFMYEKMGFLGFFTGINQSFANSYSSVNTHHREHQTVRFLSGFEMFLQTMIKFINAKNADADKYARQMVEAITVGEKYYFSPNKKLQMLYILPAVNSDQIDKVTQMVLLLRKRLKQYQQKFPGVTALLGGSFPLLADEFLSTKEDFSYPSIIALVLILLLFYISFKNFSSTMLTLLTLILGIIMAFGLGIFVMRELNLVSSFFLVLLIGLGIDFGIHISSHFNDYYFKYKDIEKTIAETFKDSGMGIIVGAMTTALAFLTLMIPSAKAFRQLGFYAGAGIMICLLYMLLVLPSFLVWRFRKKQPKQSKIKVEYKILSKTGEKSVKYRYVIIIAMFAIAVACVFIGKHVGFNYDLLSLQPRGTSGIIVAEKVVKAMNLSPSSAVVSTTDIEINRRISRRFKKLAYVGRVDTITDYIPSSKPEYFENQKNRMNYISEIKKTHGGMNYKIISRQIIDKVLYQLKDFRDRIIELSYAETLGGLKLVKQKRVIMLKKKNLFGRLKTLLENADEKTLKKLQTLEKHFSILMIKRVKLMTKISINPIYPVISVENLPESIKNNYISDSGNQFIVRIYPHKNIWEERFLRRFVKATGRINKGVTGMPVLFLEVTDIMRKEGWDAVIYAFIAIFALLIITYMITGKSRAVYRFPVAVLKSMLTSIPLIIGAVITVAVMKLIGMRFNIYNITAIPLLLGMGVDDGVHITQRYITENYKNLPAVLQHTGKGVVLTTLTTMVSFGTLGFMANHTGMGSFGILVFIGMGAAMVVSVVLLPPLLHTFLRKIGKNINANKGEQNEKS